MPTQDSPPLPTPAADDAPIVRVDPSRLKGLSHPMRVDILDQLALHGPATASMLAARLGESSGVTSYHLRQLERHRFVEEEVGRGSTRERWWKIQRGGLSISPSDVIDDPVALAATEAVVHQMVGQRARQLDRFVSEGLWEFGLDWVEASAVTSSALTMTRDELIEFGAKFDALLREALASYRGREDVPGARRVIVQFNAFPIVGGPKPPIEAREES